MLGGLRALLRALFELLPIKVTDQELEQANPQVREALPVNFAAVAANGFFFPTAGKVVAAGLLLTWFVSELTPSAFWVGIIVPIQYGLANLTEPVAANWLATKQRRAGYYTAQAVLRGALWTGLALASFLLGAEQPILLLIIFYLIVTADAIAAGVGTIVFNDTIARVIPQRVRGRVRGWRGIFGGIVAGLIGLIIQTSFSADSGIGAYAMLSCLSSPGSSMRLVVWCLGASRNRKLPHLSASGPAWPR